MIGTSVMKKLMLHYFNLSLLYVVLLKFALFIVALINVALC